MPVTDKSFTGSIPELYDRLMVPLIFEPYAHARPGAQTDGRCSARLPASRCAGAPFEDAQFDAVLCKFGAMFFPDRPMAYRQAKRVLKPGGTYLFNVWDRIEDNEFADEVTRVLASLFPSDPPRFLARTPHGHHDPDAIRTDLRAAAFETVSIVPVEAVSAASSPYEAAMA